MREYELQAGGRGVLLILPDGGVSNAICMPCVSSERRAFASAFSLADTALIIPDTDWNRDMSPWPNKRVFRGGEDFTGGAPEFLQILCGDIIPAAERFMGAEPERRAIAGYSLAGLFAVWAIFNTDMFSRAASVSGSLWYPDFVSRMSAKAPCKTPERVYFSLGDGESKTRNKSLAAVDECTQAVFNIMRSLGADTVFEHNEGGHYNDPVGRTMRGLGWLFR